MRYEYCELRIGDSKSVYVNFSTDQRHERPASEAGKDLALLSHDGWRIVGAFMDDGQRVVMLQREITDITIEGDLPRIINEISQMTKRGITIPKPTDGN